MMDKREYLPATVLVVDQGKITIPSRIRKLKGIKDGDSIKIFVGEIVQPTNEERKKEKGKLEEEE